MTETRKFTYTLVGLTAASAIAVLLWGTFKKPALVKANEEKGNNFMRTAVMYRLHNTLTRQDAKAFAELIDGNKDPQLDRSSIMQFAAFMGDVSIVKVLLERGWDVNGIARDGAPLKNSSQVGHINVVKLFIQHGAKVNACGEDGKTALAYAAEGGHKDTLLFLLKKGASVNTQVSRGCISDPGYTPLMFAVREDHPEVVKILLEKHADVKPESAHGDTALSLAKKHRRGEIVEMLEAAGATR
jgi:ankyrin repeat protein